MTHVHAELMHSTFHSAGLTCPNKDITATTNAFSAVISFGQKFIILHVKNINFMHYIQPGWMYIFNIKYTCSCGHFFHEKCFVHVKAYTILMILHVIFMRFTHISKEKHEVFTCQNCKGKQDCQFKSKKTT